ncbi:hypothetical protein PV11_06196 [Exophiala sideris]|uniref:Uncharacterized protein n=1 Tax=Exophiala sideris TaxID=1016849 RepID=A0A0D1WTV9_9EURO|nr:hypothetical protein PV11_06196 [Exophiala sideris]
MKASFGSRMTKPLQWYKRASRNDRRLDSLIFPSLPSILKRAGVRHVDLFQRIVTQGNTMISQGQKRLQVGAAVRGMHHSSMKSARTTIDCGYSYVHSASPWQQYPVSITECLFDTQRLVRYFAFTEVPSRPTSPAQ